MFPDLSYFFHAVLGTDVDNWTSIFKTFGVFLAISFLGAAWVLRSELERKELQGLIKPIPVKQTSTGFLATREAFVNGLVAFFIGFKVPYVYQNFDAFKLDPAGLIFSMKGHWFLGGLAAVLIGLYYFVSTKNLAEEQKEKNLVIHAHMKVGDIIMVAAISGILGSRLFSILENFGDFLRDPIGQLLSGSGLTIYGGLILGFVGVYLYVKKLNINPLHVMDITALAYPLAYAIGRMGCHFSGDGDWGIVASAEKPSWFIFPDWLWSYEYPHNVLMEGVKMKDCVGIYCNKLAEGVYPTSIYEIVGSLLLFWVLWVSRKNFKTFGLLFFVFLFFNGIQRFFVEYIRVNPRYDLFGLDWSMSQFIAFAFMIAGIIGVILLKAKGNSGSDSGGNASSSGPKNYSQIGHQI